tara:strand:- start:3144 stop:4013 length:870 start_codon:yes stop_codon:yes gene_type:complete
MFYHYTSLNGFLGILESQGVWASHGEYLNDSTEISHALNFAKSFAGGIFMEDDYLAAFGWALRHGLGQMERDAVYVCSFSEKPDLLSQWRGYCPKGAGICLGFDKEVVQTYCDHNDFVLSECLYDEQKQRKHVYDLVNGCFQSFPKPMISRDKYNSLSVEEQCEQEVRYREHTSEGQGKLEADAAIKEFCDLINECAPLMKNYGFHEEAEWRVVARNPNSEVLYRAANSHLVPYINLSILKHNKDALQKVIIGPNPSAQRCAASVVSALKSKGFEHAEVEISSIPFSSW